MGWFGFEGFGSYSGGPISFLDSPQWCAATARLGRTKPLERGHRQAWLCHYHYRSLTSAHRGSIGSGFWLKYQHQPSAVPQPPSLLPSPSPSTPRLAHSLSCMARVSGCWVVDLAPTTSAAVTAVDRRLTPPLPFSLARLQAEGVRVSVMDEGDGAEKGSRFLGENAPSETPPFCFLSFIPLLY